MEQFTRIQQQILEHLPYGKDNAIPKAKLMEITGLSERSVRQNIAILRNKSDVIICSNSRSKGYYYPLDENEAQEFINETIHRIIELYASKKKAEEWVKKNKNQVRIEIEVD